MQRLRGLDGLRGIAIALVMVFHAALFGEGTSSGIGQTVYRAVASVGWIGVDLFFVLSGFLITRILIRRRGTPHYFRDFYARRTLRIFPLYYAFLAASFVAASVFGGPDLEGVGYVLTYTSNFAIAFGRWEVVPWSMAHFWSLAVEEQFYLVWPVVVLLLGPRGLGWACLLLLVAGPFVRGILYSAVSVDAPYVLTPARMDSLAAGALLAVLGSHARGLGRGRPLAWAGLGLGLASFAAVVVWRRNFDWWDSIVSFGGFSILTLVFGTTLLIVLTSRTDSRLLTVLESRGLVSAGKFSYAAYVFHQPVFIGLAAAGFSVPELGNGLGAELLFLVAGTGFTYLLAVLSWHVLERPFLSLKRHFA